MARKPKVCDATVSYFRHDKGEGANIPTRELKDLADAGEVRETRTLSGRDPSLGPQLVWKRKDVRGQADLADPTVPVSVQEKTLASAIVAGLERRDMPARPREPLSVGSRPLSGEFGGLPRESTALCVDLEPLPENMVATVGSTGWRGAPGQIKDAIVALCSWKPLCPSEFAQYIGRNPEHVSEACVGVLAGEGPLDPNFQTSPPPRPAVPRDKAWGPEISNPGSLGRWASAEVQDL